MKINNLVTRANKHFFLVIQKILFESVLLIQNQNDTRSLNIKSVIVTLLFFCSNFLSVPPKVEIWKVM